MTLDEIQSEKDELFKLALPAFDFNKEETLAWFKTDNLNFGGTSPNMLICMGRGSKVKEFILAAKQNLQNFIDSSKQSP